MDYHEQFRQYSLASMLILIKIRERSQPPFLLFLSARLRVRTAMVGE